MERSVIREHRCPWQCWSASRCAGTLAFHAGYWDKPANLTALSALRERRRSLHTGDRRRSSIPRELQSHLAVTGRIVRPAFAHLDEQEKMHRLLDQVCDFPARLGPDRLDGLAALSER